MKNDSPAMVLPKAIVAPNATQTDRDLAAALGVLDEPAHAMSECNESVRSLALETFLWIAGAVAVWIAVAIIS